MQFRKSGSAHAEGVVGCVVPGVPTTRPPKALVVVIVIAAFAAGLAAAGAPVVAALEAAAATLAIAEGIRRWGARPGRTAGSNQ